MSLKKKSTHIRLRMIEFLGVPRIHIQNKRALNNNTKCGEHYL